MTCPHNTIGKMMITHDGISHPSGVNFCFDCRKTIYEIIEEARADERKKIYDRVGILRQWLNEKSADVLVTNTHIELWLGLKP